MDYVAVLFYYSGYCYENRNREDLVRILGRGDTAGECFSNEVYNSEWWVANSFLGETESGKRTGFGENFKSEISISIDTDDDDNEEDDEGEEEDEYEYDELEEIVIYNIDTFP